jgi:hypothetical protein
MVWAEGDFLAVEYDWANPVVEAGATLPVSVMVWTWGLGAGTHNGTVHVVDVLTGRELQVPVTMVLEEAPPSLGVATPELWFETEDGGPPADPEPVYLFNLGGGEVSFTATSSVSWASVADLRRRAPGRGPGRARGGCRPRRHDGRLVQWGDHPRQSQR